MLRRTRTSSLILVTFFLGVAPLSVTRGQVVRSQQTNTQRGQFIDGILRTLVDSRKAAPSPQPLTAVPSASASQSVVTARRSLQDFANEAGQLITALRYEERYSPYVRSLLGDAFTVKATADVLAQRSQSMVDVSQLASEYAELDRQWRLLGHQLQQTANLSNTVTDRVTRLNQLNDQLANRSSSLRKWRRATSFTTLRRSVKT